MGWGQLDALGNKLTEGCMVKVIKPKKSNMVSDLRGDNLKVFKIIEIEGEGYSGIGDFQLSNFKWAKGISVIKV